METALLCMIAAAVVAVFILVGKLNAARRELSRVKYEAEDGLKNVEQLRGLNNRNEEAIASLQKENSALSVENARLSERLSFIEVEKDKMKKGKCSSACWRTRFLLPNPNSFGNPVKIVWMKF